MWAFLGLLAAGIFLLGICSALFLMYRVLVYLLDPTGKSKPTQAPPVPKREAELNIVVRETLRAFSAGKLGPGARDEMLAYVNGVKAEELRKREVACMPVLKPAARPTQPPVPTPPPPLECAAPGGASSSAVAHTVTVQHAPRPVVPLECVAPGGALVPGASKDGSLDPNTPKNGVPCARSRTWAERLFTPENVRILQSLGIGLIFFSAVAYVRTQMWDSVSAPAQMVLLLAGTAACMGLGFALRRWTELRITGLGFLILGHLSMVLDAVAALVPTGANSGALYPFQPGSLWTVTLTLFTASAYWHARTLKEPLFEAFTFFGALAAWGAGAQWLEISLWHLALAYVPALLACRFLYPVLTRPDEGLRRWSLPWWLLSAWELGAPLLASAQVIIALSVDSTFLGQDLWLYQAALVGLGAAMFWDATVSGRKQMAHFGCAALLAVWPLTAFAVHAAWWVYPMTVALPAAGLTLAALTWSRWRGGVKDEAFEIVVAWGIAVVSSAAAAAALARLLEPAAAVSAAWTAAALVSTGLALVVLRASVVGAWLAVVGNAMLSAMVLDLTGMGLEWMPPLWLAFATVAALFSSRNAAHALASTARNQADLLALGAVVGGVWFCIGDPHAVWLFTSGASGLTGPAPAYQFLTWLAVTAFMLISSYAHRSPKRRVLGVALLGPTLLYGLNMFSLRLATPAVWTTALAAGLWFAVDALARYDQDHEQRTAGWSGAGLLLLQGVLLSFLDLLRPAYGLAAWDYVALGGVLSVVAVRCRGVRVVAETCVAVEAVTLGLFSAAALCCAATFELDPIQWASLLPLLAALALLLAMAGEWFAGMNGAVRPFRVAGEIVALALGLAGLSMFLFQYGLLMDCPLHVVWLAGLPMLFLAVRERMSGVGGERLHGEPRLVTVLASGHLVVTALLCIGLSLYWNFWDSTIHAGVRLECALFYTVLLAAGILVGVWLRSAFAPILGGCAALALVACAYGGWGISYQTFGLPAMLTALALLTMGVGLRRAGRELRAGQCLSAYFTGGLTALFAGAYLICVLIEGPMSGLQAASVSAWLLAAMACWYAGRGGSSWLSGLGCGTSLLLAGMHGLRWGGVAFTAFGPAIGAFALTLLAAREVVEFFDTPADVKPIPLRGRAGGLLVTACAAMVLAGVFALAGHLDHLPWHWVGTLCEGALFLGALTVLSRRRAREASGGMLLLTELGMWLALIMALGFSLQTLGCGSVLQGVLWAGFGALVLLTGMMMETAAGGVIGPSAQARVPGAFLESRHIAAAGCAGLAILTALGAPESGIDWVTGLWQACLGAALLAIYGSLARTSISSAATKTARYGSALAAYTVLLPLGYLAFLKSQSTGDSWGATWFLELAPVLLGVAWLLEQEREMEQAALAKIGALLVSGGALVLAFATNHDVLSAVPAWTLFGLMVEALLMRRWHGRKEWTVVALAALSGAVFYAMRALRGDPAWGMAEAWVFEGTVMAGLGLALTLAGGASRWEPDEDGHSIPGMCGAGLVAVSISLMVIGLLTHGTAAGYLGVENTARLDAFSIALILGAGTAWASARWLGFGYGRWLAPVQLLTAYGLTLWAWHVVAWEYYTIPAALACFFWARQSEHTAVRDEQVSRIWQILGSALLMIPSFIQAMPYTDASVTHFFVLAVLALLLVGGAMWARRKIPMLSASSALLLCTIVKTAQWAAHHNATLPAAGFGLGVGILALGCVFESRMNRVLRTAADQVKAQARMFWTNWD